jgi:serine/threonine protein kinase
MANVRPLFELVHRDLAARNVLISHSLQAKVSDYGFSRHTAIKMESESCYYKMNTMRPLPVRWTVRWWWNMAGWTDCGEGVHGRRKLTRRSDHHLP